MSMRRHAPASSAPKILSCKRLVGTLDPVPSIREHRPRDHPICSDCIGAGHPARSVPPFGREGRRSRHPTGADRDRGARKRWRDRVGYRPPSGARRGQPRVPHRGRMIERSVAVGDRVEAGRADARLEPDNELTALHPARAAVAAAAARLTQTRNAYSRQATLLQRGFTTRALYDEAAYASQTAQAEADAAQAQADTAENQLRFTELIADPAGVVVARGAEPGEVVAAGQMIVQIARQGGRDAVFDVPARLIRMVPGSPEIEVSLTAEPDIKTTRPRPRGGPSG